MSKSTKTSPQPTSFRFEEDLKEALKIIADQESRSVANTIEWLAKDYFKQNKIQWPQKRSGAQPQADDDASNGEPGGSDSKAENDS